jgi:hypothetical protein
MNRVGIRPNGIDSLRCLVAALLVAYKVPRVPPVNYYRDALWMDVARDASRGQQNRTVRLAQCAIRSHR